MYDVIVVGAGPAGSTCARVCAKSGLRTLLLDKAVFPRSKPCGGAVSLQALSYLDFAVPREIIERECSAVHLRMGTYAAGAAPPYKIAVLVKRERFDSFLAEKAREAKALFFPGEKVIDVLIHHDHLEVKTVKTAYRASFLVGADGVHSRVAHGVRPPFKKNEMALALVSLVPAEACTRDGDDGSLGMYFGMVSMGYGWAFPHDGYYSVGVMARASQFSDPLKAFSDFSRSLGIPCTSPQGHFIPYGGVKRKIASGRILLAGDAAGFADPLHGEGIGYAILSGKLAGQAVTKAVKGNGTGVALSWYERESERLIRKNLRIALCMARLIHLFPALSKRIFFDNQCALSKYLDIPAGRLDYRRFQRWLMLRAPFYLASSYLKDVLT